MSSFNEAYERIQFATNTRTQVELAEVLDIRQSSISDAKRRNSVPADWYMKLFEKFGLNPDWLKQGMGPMYLRTEDGYIPQDAPDKTTGEQPAYYGEPIAKSIMASCYSMACSYNDGGSHPELLSVGKISMSLAFAEKVTILHMEAPNMEPTLRRGAYFGVDTTETAPVSGNVYAIFSPHEGLILRRIFLDENNGRYLLRSDAPGYPETGLEPDVLTRRLFGRVVWVLQEL